MMAYVGRASGVGLVVAMCAGLAGCVSPPPETGPTAALRDSIGGKAVVISAPIGADGSFSNTVTRRGWQRTVTGYVSDLGRRNNATLAYTCVEVGGTRVKTVRTSGSYPEGAWWTIAELDGGRLEFRVRGTHHTFSSEKLRLSTNLLEQTAAILEKAVNTQDATPILAHLASNVVIRVTFPDYGPEYPAMMFTKETYEQYLRDSWTKAENITWRRVSSQNEIAADGLSATATGTFRETGIIKETGLAFVATGRQVSHIRLMDGRPQAESIEVSVSFK